MERSDATTLQLIELYEKRPYVCDKVAACDWTIAAYATLSRDFVAHSRDKIARQNCRCDIGLTCTVYVGQAEGESIHCEAFDCVRLNDRLFDRQRRSLNTFRHRLIKQLNVSEVLLRNRQLLISGV